MHKRLIIFLVMIVCAGLMFLGCRTCSEKVTRECNKTEKIESVQPEKSQSQKSNVAKSYVISECNAADENISGLSAKEELSAKKEASEILSEVKESEKENKIYVVKDGQTLWNISAEESVYGDPEKWRYIYEANRDVINNPNKLRAGLKLKIPNIENVSVKSVDFKSGESLSDIK